jgi:hypothetical protein
MRVKFLGIKSYLFIYPPYRHIYNGLNFELKFQNFQVNENFN